MSIEVSDSFLREKMENNINPPLVVNFTNQGDGNFIFKEIHSVPAMGNKVCTICYPLDIVKDGKLFGSSDAKKLNQKKEFVLGENDRVAFPRGTLSSERDVYCYFPFNMEETDVRFKQTKMYIWMKPLQDTILRQKMEIDSMHERLRETVELVQKIISLELPTIELEKVLSSLKSIDEFRGEPKPVNFGEMKIKKEIVDKNI